jgi:Hint domain
MAKTFSASYSNVTLSDPTYNPVYVTGTITGTRSALEGAAAAAWTIANSGLIAGGTSASTAGIRLDAGGLITNQSGGTISGHDGIAIYGGAGTVVDAGSITGAGTAVAFASGYANTLIVDPGAAFIGKVNGANTLGADAISTLQLAYGTIAGTLTGLGTQFVNFASIGVYSSAIWTLASAALGSGYTIYDAGTLTNRGSLGSAVTLAPGAVFSNAASALVTAGSYAASVYGESGGAATVINAGIIRNSGTADGIKLDSGGHITNIAGGTVSGFYAGIGIYNAVGSLTNAGLITATGTSSDGVFLQKGGVVINQASGTIIDPFASNYGAVDVPGASTVMNAGTISGVTTAVEFYSGYAARLIVEPRAMFNGQVVGGNLSGTASASYLELASGTVTGTLAGLGTQFINFGRVAMDAGASWSLTGATVVAGQTFTALMNSTLADSGALYNYGVISFDPSTLNVGSLLGSGVAVLGAGSTLDLQATLASLGTITFTGSAELLLGAPTLVAGNIQGFAIGDTIDLAGVDPTSVTYASGQLYFGSGNSILLNLASGGTPVASTDGNGGALVTLCFRAGTRIATTKGEIAVEHLAIGDRVRVRGGLLPITWIGRRRIDCTRHPRPQFVWPVRISRNAFSDGVPSRDLWLSPDHAVYQAGLLIPVKYLINGVTISQVSIADLTYYHIELPHHDVLLAEGMSVESYLEAGDRANFNNGGTSLRLHPDFASRTWEARGCAPLVVSGPHLEAVRARLAHRARQRVTKAVLSG